MSPNPASFLEHLQSRGYHPRSDKHSNALAEAIAADLHHFCPAIQRDAAAGKLVYDLNFTLFAGAAEWNVDLVFGAPALDVKADPEPSSGMPRARPSTIQIAIEIKSVMTEHRKAVKNRKRDLEAHHEHVHNYNASCIAGGVLVVNASSTFKSPLRSDTSVHRDSESLVRHCISEFRSVSARGGQTGYGLEAKCAIVVDFDNVHLEAAKFAKSPLAPSVGDQIHYDNFVRSICNIYRERFAGA